LQIKTKIVSCHTADSKPVQQEVKGTVILRPGLSIINGVAYRSIKTILSQEVDCTVILPPLLFPALSFKHGRCQHIHVWGRIFMNRLEIILR